MYGGRARGKYMTLFYAESQEKTIGIAVSKRVKNAVARNRAKRRFREVLRHNIQLAPWAEQVWLLEPEVAVIPFIEIKEDFARACNKILSRT